MQNVERRQWRCPGCQQVYAIPNHRDDPILCPSCTKQAEASNSTLIARVDHTIRDEKLKAQAGASSTTSDRGGKRPRWKAPLRFTRTSSALLGILGMLPITAFVLWITFFRFEERGDSFKGNAIQLTTAGDSAYQKGTNAVRDNTTEDSRELSGPEINDHVSPAVVVIHSFHEEHRLGQGSGFVITPQNVIVTNEHVIRGASSLLVTSPTGQQVEINHVFDQSVGDVVVLEEFFLAQLTRELPLWTVLRVDLFTVASMGPRHFSRGN